MKKISSVAKNVMKFIMCLEVFISFVILCVILIMTYNMCANLVTDSLTEMSKEKYIAYLSTALSLVVGLEFVKLLCNYKPSTLTTVMLLAISRQMIVEHLNMYEIVAGISALAIIFIIRRYLLMEEAKDFKIDIKNEENIASVYDDAI